MSFINIVLRKIINRNYDFCCLCYNTINDTPIRFNDKVSLVENDTVPNVEVAELLCYLFGDELFREISSFNALCEQCITTATMSYKFITKTKEDTQYLFKALEHLADCFESTPPDLEDTKSLFVVLNPDLCTTNQFYDNVGLVSSTTTVLKRFQSIANLKTQSTAVKIENSPKKEKIKLKIKNMLDSNNPNEIKCKECSKSFQSFVYLKSHFIRTHAPKSHICQHCSKGFGSKTFLTMHISESHSSLVCTECGKAFQNKSTLKMHEKGHYLRLVCPDCGRIYKNHNTYKKHIDNNVCQSQTRSTPAKGKYTCDYCQKKYSQKITLRVHIQYEHLNYKYHECQWCDKKFYCQSRLKAHSVKHTKERNFTCTICEGKFVTKESLLYHTRIHTGEKPYPCPQCDSRFISASRRLAHIKSHHINTTVECDICHSNFKTYHYLQRHKKVTHATVQSSEQKSSQTEPIKQPLEEEKVQIGMDAPKKRKLLFNVENRTKVLHPRILNRTKSYGIKASGQIKLQSEQNMQFTGDTEEIIVTEIKPDGTEERLEFVYRPIEDYQQASGGKIYLEVPDEDDSVLKVT